MLDPGCWIKAKRTEFKSWIFTITDYRSPISEIKTDARSQIPVISERTGFKERDSRFVKDLPTATTDCYLSFTAYCLLPTAYLGVGGGVGGSSIRKQGA